MTNYVAIIERLSTTAVVDRMDEPEHVLHELAHLATVDPGLDIWTREVIPAWSVSRIVSARIMALRESYERGGLLADWREVVACAVELRMAALIGKSDEVGGAADVLNENVQILGIDEACRTIDRLVWCESTYRSAIKALGLGTDDWMAASSDEGFRATLSRGPVTWRPK